MSPHADDAALVAFLLREDAEADAEVLSTHLLGCERCSDRLDVLTRHEAWIDELRRNAHEPVQTRAGLEAMVRRGLVLQHSTGIDGEIVTERVNDDADVVVTHVPIARTSDAMDVHICTLDGRPFITKPVTLEEGSPSEVLVACHAVVARTSPGIRIKVERKTAVGRETVADVQVRNVR